MIVPVLAKTRFEYSHLSASTSQTVVLQPEINTGAFYYYQLIVRVHERSFSSSQTIMLGLYNTLPSDEDPREFTDSSSGGILNITITAASPAVPGIKLASGTDPGAFLKLLLTASQPAGGGTLYAELSAVLVLRCA